ncbi:hypothetical protein BGZ98_009026 [Dissophora globulifera]|nr:hypothetical protein BGZ98_009026 [Dissophora globulifera]
MPTAMGFTFSVSQKTAHRNCQLTSRRQTISNVGSRQIMKGTAKTDSTNTNTNAANANKNFQIKK